MVLCGRAITLIIIVTKNPVLHNTYRIVAIPVNYPDHYGILYHEQAVLSSELCPLYSLVRQLYLEKPVKRFQMKSNGCRDVQHTGLQSTQTRRNTGKQGAQTRGHSAHLPKHPYISGCTSCLTTKLFSNFCNLELISISYNYHAATDVGMLGKMCRVPPCLYILLSVPSCLCAL